MITTLLNLSRSAKKDDSVDSPNRTWAQVLCDQLIDSAIVAGITAASDLAVGGGGAQFYEKIAIAFVLTFLVKLKEYRGLEG